MKRLIITLALAALACGLQAPTLPSVNQRALHSRIAPLSVRIDVSADVERPVLGETFSRSIKHHK